MPSQAFVTRFAPSPTGYLHRGHAFSALSAWNAAREADGRFLLRIEDIDVTRCRPRFEAAIVEDLTWLGLDWEQPVRRQSEHVAEYRAALDELRSRGLVYPCARTRREVLESLGSAPQASNVPDTREAHPGQPIAWRLSLEAADRAVGGLDGLTFREHGEEIRVDPARIGDLVLGRKDVGVSYHLACVLDDALQEVTCVIRGEDLFDATHTQRLLQALLGLPTPSYRHHPLVLRPDGKRFAKRDTAETLRELRGNGVTPEQVIASLPPAMVLEAGDPPCPPYPSATS